MILRDQWMQRAIPDGIVAVEELAGRPFALGFDCYASESDLAKDEYFSGPKLYDDQERGTIDYHYTFMRFDVLFDYKTQPDFMRLRDVFFNDAIQGQGMGCLFLGKAIMPTALDLNCHQIFVEPGLDGSHYWTSRGAEMKTEDAFWFILARANMYCSDGKFAAWPLEKMHELFTVLLARDFKGLRPFIDNDGLTIGKRKARHALLGRINLGECVFDLDDPWTQACLKKRVGFDVELERARRAIPDMAGSPHEKSTLDTLVP